VNVKHVLALALVLLCPALPAPAQEQPAADPAVDAFWAKFQAAVAKGDKAAVASMTKFPLEMPYGVTKIRTKAQLASRYGEVFDAETKKCFAEARPQIEGAKFTISCGEAMLYWFEKVNGEYKLSVVDNVNE
jgi:hypothetical protein